jgi:hypothetical protein
MPIKIKLPPEVTQATQAKKEEKKPQASISLKIKKTLDGNLLIDDHQHMDIVIVPSKNKLMTIPKPYAEKEVYPYQKDLMYDLFKGGVLVTDSTEGGAKFGVVEATYPTEGDVNTMQSLLYRLENYLVKTAGSEKHATEYDQHIEDRFTDPSDEESTDYGEVPPYEDTPEGRRNADPTTYSYYGAGYLY